MGVEEEAADDEENRDGCDGVDNEAADAAGCCWRNTMDDVDGRGSLHAIHRVRADGLRHVHSSHAHSLAADGAVDTAEGAAEADELAAGGAVCGD